MSNTVMRHLAEDTLRRLIDEPAGVADPDRRHVADCPRCLAALADQREDTGPARTPARPGRLAAALRRPAVAALAVAMVLSGAGVAAASGWLEIFRTERIGAIGIGAADLVALPDLGAFGDLEVSRGVDVRQVPDAAAAAAATGLDVPVATVLPRGVEGEPTYQVGGKVRATFTFSADRAREAAAGSGERWAAPPPGMDGSRVRLDAGPGVATVWTRASGAPTLIVGRAVAPTASASGVPFATMRDYLLALPGLPDDVAAQLRALGADGATLPLPVPADEVTTASTQIDGVPATVLASRDETIAAVVWVDAGVVTAVAGSLDTGEVLSIARGLR